MHQPALHRIVTALDCGEFTDLAPADLAAAEYRLYLAERRWPGLASPSPYLAFLRRVIEAPTADEEVVAASA